jgi:hypothetical protein
MTRLEERLAAFKKKHGYGTPTARPLGLRAGNFTRRRGLVFARGMGYRVAVPALKKKKAKVKHKKKRYTKVVYTYK